MKPKIYGIFQDEMRADGDGDEYSQPVMLFNLGVFTKKEVADRISAEYNKENDELNDDDRKGEYYVRELKMK